jgi:hypothetical protein
VQRGARQHSASSAYQRLHRRRRRHRLVEAGCGTGIPAPQKGSSAATKCRLKDGTSQPSLRTAKHAHALVVCCSERLSVPYRRARRGACRTLAIVVDVSSASACRLACAARDCAGVLAFVERAAARGYGVGPSVRHGLPHCEPHRRFQPHCEPHGRSRGHSWWWWSFGVIIG